MYVDLLYSNVDHLVMAKNICKRFGQRIKKLRLEKGWSQEKMAEVADFHRTYIGMVERGERNPSLKSIERFAKAFDVTIKELFWYEETK